MRLARKQGISLRRFLGWEPARYYDSGTGRVTQEAEYDEWERALWRAYADWESNCCPDCGQPLSESLWDPEIPEQERAKWRAVYWQCRACLELENAQTKQQELDKQRSDATGRPVPHRHRKWTVSRDDERGR